MKRRLFTVLCFLSLVLLVIVLAVWVMSCVAPHRMLVHEESEFFYDVEFDRGAVNINYVMHVTPDESPFVQFERSVSDTYEPEFGMNAELLVPVRWATKPGTGSDLVVALWALAVVFAALPAWWVWVRWRRGNERRGFEVEARQG